MIMMHDKMQFLSLNTLGVTAASGTRRPKSRAGSLIFLQFASFPLQGVRCAACVTFPLGIAEDCEIDMPAGLE